MLFEVRARGKFLLADFADIGFFACMNSLVSDEIAYLIKDRG